MIISTLACSFFHCKCSFFCDHKVIVVLLYLKTVVDANLSENMEENLKNTFNFVQKDNFE